MYVMLLVKQFKVQQIEVNVCSSAISIQTLYVHLDIDVRHHTFLIKHVVLCCQAPIQVE